MTVSVPCVNSSVYYKGVQRDRSAFEQAFSLFFIFFLPPELVFSWVSQQIQLIALWPMHTAVKGKGMLPLGSSRACRNCCALLTSVSQAIYLFIYLKCWLPDLKQLFGQCFFSLNGMVFRKSMLLCACAPVCMWACCISLPAPHVAPQVNE